MEQSSSLLLTLALALLYKLTPFSVPTVGYLFGIAAGWLGVLRAGVLAGKRGPPPSWALVFASMTSPLLAYWTLGGMETTLVGWLFVEIAIAQGAAIDGRIKPWSRRVVLVSLAFAMARPEASIIGGCALLGVLGVLALHAITDLVRRGPPSEEAAETVSVTRAAMSRVLGLIGVTVGCAALLVAFREAYFGQPFPQPVAVKTGEHIGMPAVRAGLDYVKAQLPRGDTGLLVACLPVAIVVLLARRVRRGDEWLPIMLLVAHFGFVVVSRGDWMAGGRFVAHAVPLMAYLLFRGLGWVRPVIRHVATAALAILNLYGLWYVAGKIAPGRPLWNELKVDAAIRETTRAADVPWVDRANQTHTRDALLLTDLYRVIDKILEQKGKDERVVIMSGQAGMVMYYVASRYYGRVEFIDRHALTSKHLDAIGREMNIYRSTGGLEMTTPQFFAAVKKHPELMPDLVFDLNPTRRNDAARNGFTCVFEQTGPMRASPPDWFTIRGNTYQFISVKNQYAPAILGSEKGPRVAAWTHEL